MRHRVACKSHRALEHVASRAVMRGTCPERCRFREYLNWTIAYRLRRVPMADTLGRDDATEVSLPAQHQVPTSVRSVSQNIENETNAFGFTAMDEEGSRQRLNRSARPKKGAGLPSEVVVMPKWKSAFSSCRTDSKPGANKAKENPSGQKSGRMRIGVGNLAQDNLGGKLDAKNKNERPNSTRKCSWT